MTAVSRLGASRLRTRRLAMWAAIGALLLLPAIAMQFTAEMAWDRADFAAAALLLVGGGMAFEVGAWMMDNPRHRALLGAVIVLVLTGIWADAPVGIF